MMRNRAGHWAVLALLAMMTAACGGAQGVSPQATLGTRDIPVYRLAADDKVKITVFGEDALSGTFLVGSDGTIAYPLVGRLPAKGLTLVQLTEQLTDRLGAQVKNPQVSVAVEEYRPFYILGEVNRPGQYPYRTGMTIDSAVATAGGFTYRANHKHVLIQHLGEVGERRYDLNAGLPVLPGDTIRIRERYF